MASSIHKVAVTMENGVVTDVVTDGVQLDVVVINYDIEYAADEDVKHIPQVSGGQAECTLYNIPSETSDELADWVRKVHEHVYD